MATKPGQEKTTTSSQAPSTFSKLRASKNARLWVIGGLLVITGLLFIFWAKARIALAIIFITLLAAFGLEVSENDWDLQKLWQTQSFEESKVGRDAQGNILFDKFGNMTTDSSKGKKANDYNCDDFSTQPEAQAFFERVGGTGNDINRLDANKDGQACESLPKGSAR